MLIHLSDYTALIQLLVGSIFISNIFISRSNPYEKEIKRLCESFKTKFQGDEKFTTSYDLNKESSGFKSLFTYTMVLLAVYGCFILFYCANCTEVGCPSPLGIALLSTIVTLFQLYAIVGYRKCVYGSTKIYKIFFWISLFLSVLVFAIFIIIFPEIIQFSDIHIKLINAWVFINFILWFGLFVRCHTTYIKVNNVINDMFNDMEIYTQVNLKSRIETAIKLYHENCTHIFQKRHCIKVAKDQLKKNELYYLDINDKSITVDTKLSGDLESAIEGSKIPRIIKHCLKHCIIKQVPTDPANLSKITVSNILEERNKVIDDGFEELCKIGIIHKIRNI